MHRLLSNQIIRIPMEKTKFGDPPYPLNEPYFDQKKGKFQKYPRRAYLRVPKKFMGSQVTKILGFHVKKYFGDLPYPFK